MRVEAFPSALLWLALGCAAPVIEPHASTEIVDAPGATGEGFHDPTASINGVRGGGDGEGSLDVYSIDYGSYLVLGWDGARVTNGPGIDFAVFENPFQFGDGLTFMDAAVVELSLDGVTWVTFPHDYLAEDETMYSARREHWVGFAGIEPVYLNEETNAVDPFDPAAGGDRFDLETLPPDGEAGRIRDEGFLFLRISPALDHENPDTGQPFPRSPVANGPDIDGVYARYVVSP